LLNSITAEMNASMRHFIFEPIDAATMERMHQVILQAMAPFLDAPCRSDWLFVEQVPGRPNEIGLRISPAAPDWFVERVKAVCATPKERLCRVCCWKMEQRKLAKRMAYENNSNHTV